MPLVPITEPFDHPDWLFELKHDGFRALAHVRGHLCELVSRHGFTLTKFSLLAEEIAHSVRAHDAVLHGEIVCLAPDGRSRFYDLLFRREWPHFVAFDLLSIDGTDVRGRPLLERKRRLRRLMPRIESRLIYLDHLEQRGDALFEAVCAHDCEGIVAKWKHGTYSSNGIHTSWLKIRNPEYSAMHGRRELSEQRRDRRAIRRRDYHKPELHLR
jgi:bifunctional non-homologous end joining protein LigD